MAFSSFFPQQMPKNGTRREMSLLGSCYFRNNMLKLNTYVEMFHNLSDRIPESFSFSNN